MFYKKSLPSLEAVEENVKERQTKYMVRAYAKAACSQQTYFAFDLDSIDPLKTTDGQRLLKTCLSKVILEQSNCVIYAV